MDDYNFIKRCKNYNMKKSKGFKYESIVKKSMNKIKKIGKKKSGSIVTSQSPTMGQFPSQLTRHASN